MIHVVRELARAAMGDALALRQKHWSATAHLLGSRIMFSEMIPATVASVERNAVLSGEEPADVYDLVIECDAPYAFPLDRSQVSIASLGTRGYQVTGVTKGVLECQAFGRPLVKSGDSVRVAIGS